MTEDADPYEYILAERLGMTRGELLQRMSNDEYVWWQAFDVYREAMRKLHGR